MSFQANLYGTRYGLNPYYSENFFIAHLNDIFNKKEYQTHIVNIILDGVSKYVVSIEEPYYNCKPLHDTSDNSWKIPRNLPPKTKTIESIEKYFNRIDIFAPC